MKQVVITENNEGFNHFFKVGQSIKVFKRVFNGIYITKDGLVIPADSCVDITFPDFAYLSEENYV